MLKKTICKNAFNQKLHIDTETDWDIIRASALPQAQAMIKDECRSKGLDLVTSPFIDDLIEWKLYNVRRCAQRIERRKRLDMRNSGSQNGT